MSGVTYILIGEGAHNGVAIAGLAAPDGSGYSTTELENYVPQCETRWARMFRKVTYAVSVIGATGTAPTSWTLAARFEQLLAHTQGYQYQFPTWVPLQTEQVERCIAEGVGWYGPGQSPPAQASSYGIIATETTQADDGSGVLASALTVKSAGDATATLLAKRVTVSRTVVDQLGGMRVAFLPAITGGDSTTRIVLSVTATGVR